MVWLFLHTYKFYSFWQADGRVCFSHGISLTVQNLKDLDCCEIGEKGDPAFILKLLLALCSRDDLRLTSITGKPSRNKNYGQDRSKKFAPEKLQFIKGISISVFVVLKVEFWLYNLDKFRERVQNEKTTESDLENRCRAERIHKIINTKIQNLKRRREITTIKGDRKCFATPTWYIRKCLF